MLTIRRAEQRDARALGALGAALMRSHYAFDPQRFLAAGEGAERGYAAFLSSQLADDTAVVLVADVIAVSSDTSMPGWSRCRGRNCADRRVSSMTYWSKTMGGAPAPARRSSRPRSRGCATTMPHAMLWTAERNEDALRLFARLGFRRTMIEMTRDL